MIDKIISDKIKEIEDLKPCPYNRDKPVLSPKFNDKINIIAEIKAKSPSFGKFNKNVNTIEVYSKYAKCLSILTDKKYFGGSFEFLREVSNQVNLPILCKDFIIDKKQIDWAFGSGADIVLLIARILDKEKINELFNHAKSLGLWVLVELHSKEEIKKIDFKPDLIGVNARNLDTLAIDLDKAKKLLEIVHAPLKIAESGIRSRNDIEFFLPVVRNFLIGEALLKSSDIENTFREFLCL